MLPGHIPAAAIAVLDSADDFVQTTSAAHGASTSPRNSLRPPTRAQALAGNYPMGHVALLGMTLMIENPAHTVREGADPGGKVWRSLMKAHYGYIRGTRGADGDPVDVFLGPAPESRRAWVLNQTDAAGGFDEHKVLLGFHDERSAVDAYRLSYEPGWSRFKVPVPLSIDQLKWWLEWGDLQHELHPDHLPPESETMEPQPTTNPLPRVFWDSAAMPASGETLGGVMYALRVDDAADGLLADPVTLDDVYEGSERLTLDALVVPAGRLQPKMQALLRIMEAASTSVKPLAVQISDPVRRYGGVHVAVIFEMGDGQTVTAWFHNPDATPSRLTISDDLVSWKWQLNKKDITIVVAPERGTDLNTREVARRVMRLVEKNSAAFARLNAGRAERMAEINGLKAAVGERQTELASLHRRIEVALVERDQRLADAAVPYWARAEFDPTLPENYELIGGVEKALLRNQDRLDAFFSERVVDVRNELRALGWVADVGAPMGKGDHFANPVMKHVGSGRNVVGMHWVIGGVPGFFLSDTLRLSTAELASRIDLGLTSFLAQRAEQSAAEAPPASGHMVDPIPAVEQQPQEPAEVAQTADPVELPNQGATGSESQLQAPDVASDKEPEQTVETPGLEPAEADDVRFLRAVNAGEHDAVDLDDLLARIETSIVSLQRVGQLVGVADQAANDAITRWVELDQKRNG